jgi:hypothetical protein
MGESLIVRRGGGGGIEIDGQQIITGEYAETIAKYDTVFANLVPEFLGNADWDSSITKLTNPATLPTGLGFQPSFSPDNTYLAVAHAITPFITIYKRSGDTFTKLANPATLPPSTGYSPAFSNDGTYLAVAHATTPFITIYKTTLTEVKAEYFEIEKADNESYKGQEIGYALESGDVGDTKPIMKLFNGTNVAGQKIIEGVFAENISRLDSVFANSVPEFLGNPNWD